MSRLQGPYPGKKGVGPPSCKAPISEVQVCPYHSTRRVTPSVSSAAELTDAAGTEPVSAWNAASGQVPATQKPPGRLRERSTRRCEYGRPPGRCSARLSAITVIVPSGCVRQIGESHSTR